MDAKELIGNLIAAIEEITDKPLDKPGLMVAIEDAKEMAGLAKLVLPSLEDPAPPGEWVVYVEGTDEVVGLFPDEPTGVAWLASSGADGAAYKIQTGTAAQQGAVAPNPPPPGSNPARMPFSETPPGGLYRN